MGSTAILVLLNQFESKQGLYFENFRALFCQTIVLHAKKQFDTSYQTSNNAMQWNFVKKITVWILSSVTTKLSTVSISSVQLLAIRALAYLDLDVQ